MKIADAFPTLLQSFFIDRLMRQRQVSPHTLASYRDTFRLLVQYAQRRLRKAPSDLTMPDLDPARRIPQSHREGTRQQCTQSQRAVDAMVKKAHGQRMPQGMRGDAKNE